MLIVRSNNYFRCEARINVLMAFEIIRIGLRNLHHTFHFQNIKELDKNVKEEIVDRIVGDEAHHLLHFPIFNVIH